MDKALSLANKIDKTGFARNIKDPEILFTKDSSALYLYIEKIRRNTFDGFLSFDTDENSGRINIEGYAKINLINTFNGGEKINFDFDNKGSRKKRALSTKGQTYCSFLHYVDLACCIWSN